MSEREKMAEAEVMPAPEGVATPEILAQWCKLAELAGHTPPEDPARAWADLDPKLQRELLQQFQGRAGRSLDDSRVCSFLAENIERLRRRGRGEEQPIPMPWPGLSERLSGGLGLGLHILVGNTGSGKSQLALQAALHAALEDVPVMYIGLELGELDLTARLLGLLANVRSQSTMHKWSDLFLGKSVNLHDSTSQIDALLEGNPGLLHELEKIPFHLEFGPPMGWSYKRLSELGHQMREKYPQNTEHGKVIRGSRPFLVVLDFLQIVSSDPGNNESLRERIGRASYAARALARDHDAAVLLISSTARNNYTTLAGQSSDDNKDKGPIWEKPAPAAIGLGKESGEIEYSADTVMVMAREPWENDQPPPEGTWTWVSVSKQRAGKPSWGQLLFNGSMFYEPTEANLKARKERERHKKTPSSKTATTSATAGFDED